MNPSDQAQTRAYYKKLRKRLINIIDHENEFPNQEIEEKCNPLDNFYLNLEKAVDNLDEFLADIERYVPKGEPGIIID